MALLRARVLVGSPEARAELEAIMQSVLRKPREPEALRKDVAEMRARIAEHKKPAGRLDIKRLRGGLVDCEFLVHHLQLRGVDAKGEPLASTHPDAYSPDLGTAIPALIQAGLLPAQFITDYDLLTRMIVALRLLAPDGGDPPAYAAQALASACRIDNYEALVAALDAARDRNWAIWNETFPADISDPSTSIETTESNQ